MTFPDDYINKVIHADCLEIMRGMPDGCVDLVLTDPPYGVDYAEWDKTIPPRNYFDEMSRISGGEIVMFGAASPRAIKSVLDEYGEPERIIIWHTPFTLSMTGKNGAFYRWHPIYIWGTHKIPFPFDILSIPCDGHNAWNHPATKPIKLMEKLVPFTDGLILDPFCGSGTTLVAAKMLGRRYIGIDIEKKYCDIAEERLRNTTPPLPFVQEKQEQLRLDTGGETGV